MRLGYAEDELASAKEATWQFVLRRWPDQRDWFDRAWEWVWALAERVNVHRVGAKDLEDLLRSGMGFAEVSVDAGVEPLQGVGTIVFVLVAVGPDDLQSAGRGDLRRAAAKHGSTWGVERSLRDVLGAALEEHIRPAIVEGVAAVTGELVKPFVVEEAGADPRHMTRKELGEFKRGKPPTSFGVWLDLVKAEAWLGGKVAVRPGNATAEKPLRAVAVLVRSWGDDVTYTRLYEAVEGVSVSALEKMDREKARRMVRNNCQRWLSDLEKKSGPGGRALRAKVNTAWGVGYKWVGPDDYCIVSVRRRP